jgi:hypothetical protein
VKLSDKGWDDLKHGVKFRGPWKKPWKEMTHAERKAWDAQSLGASDFRRSQTEILGDVVEVQSNGYFIRWDGESWDAWVPDRAVVSASSTTRKWPGNHYEGVDPMAKKNRRKARRNTSKLAALVPRGTKIEKHPWGYRLIGFAQDMRIEPEEYFSAVSPNWKKEDWEAAGDADAGMLDIFRKSKGWTHEDFSWRLAARRARLSRARQKGLFNPAEARRNMAVEAHGRRFDTVGELVEYEKAYGLDPRQGGAQHRPAELAVAAAHATPEFQQMEREMRARVRGMGTGTRKSPMMFPQLTDDNWRYKGAYDAVSYYLGGQKQYAPELKAEAKKKRKKLANVGALMHMGLTPDMAFAFLSEMGSRYPSTTQEGPKGKPQIVASEITPEIQAEARAVLLPQLSRSSASLLNPRGAPPLAPSPFIGYPSQYNMPTNAGPYQTQLYPFGQGGRPATFQYESVKEVLERSPTGPAGGPSIRAARNPRYSIPLQYPEWEFDVWAPQPVVANWTSYPPYSYKQFYRQNPRKSGKTREGYIKYGSGPLGGLTPSERKSIPSHMFLPR